MSVATRGADLLSGYRAARPGAILVDRSDLGRLRIAGRDAPDLLHRLCTNAVKTLRPGEGAAAVFATPKGRIFDLVTLHRLEGHLFALTAPGRAAAVRDWIDRYTFREEVRVEDVSAGTGTLGLFGGRASRALGAVAGEAAVSRPIHHAAVVTIGGSPALVARTWPIAGEGFHLTGDRASIEAIGARLLACDDVTPADGACLEVLRIEAGLPAAGRELTEEFNPWEACLGDAISLSKGCYIGQEVIARLNTYQKVSKRLVRLVIEGDLVPPAGAAIRPAGGPAGLLTSAAAVPGEGRVVGLGYVAAGDAVQGKAATIEWPSGRAAATIAGPGRPALEAGS